MRYYTDDPAADFARWDADQNAKLACLPVCDHCGEPIQGKVYEQGGAYYCEWCRFEENE